MSWKAIEMTGQVFGRLTVIRRADTPFNALRTAMWLCQCICGKQAEVSRTRLIYGTTKSCGCLRRETAADLHLYQASARKYGETIDERRAAKAAAQPSICHAEIMGDAIVIHGARRHMKFPLTLWSQMTAAADAALNPVGSEK